MICRKKSTLRLYYGSCVKGISAEALALSNKICGHLEASSLFNSCRILAGYVPVQGEVDINPALDKWLESGRKLFLPSYSKEENRYGMSLVKGLDDAWLERGRYGIREPLSSLPKIYPPYVEKEMLWLVPGLAFTAGGIRLGRGGGYYDRLLEACTGLVVGVLYNCQLAELLPVEEHDVFMDYLVTETGVIKCNKKSCIAGQ